MSSPPRRQQAATFNATVRATVLLFAGLRERAGVRSVEVEVPSDATVADVIRAAAKAVPGELKLEARVMLALNGEYVERDAGVNDGDEVALIPPVSGGATAAGFRQVTITEDRLDPAPLADWVRTDRDGAIVTFLGVTRDHNDGRRVLHLEYEAYRPMADGKMAEIIDEMKARWEIGRVAVAHRTGRVDIGETSMVLAVSAPHRRPAFEAALYFVDRLKEIVPIWKKEYFEGGEVWIGETPGAGASGP